MNVEAMIFLVWFICGTVVTWWTTRVSGPAPDPLLALAATIGWPVTLAVLLSEADTYKPLAERNWMTNFRQEQEESYPFAPPAEDNPCRSTP